MEHLVLFIVLQRSKTTWTITHIPILCASWILHRGRFDTPLSKAPIQETRRFFEFVNTVGGGFPVTRRHESAFPFFAEPSARSRNWNFKNTNREKVRSITVYRVIWERAVSFSDDLDLYEQRSGEMELSNTSPPPPGHAWKKIVKFCTRWMGRSEVFVEWN